LRLFPILALPVFQGCLVSGKGGSATGTDERGKAGVRLLLTPAALTRSEAMPVPVLDSVHIRISAEDMAPLDFSFSGDSLDIDLEGLPAGAGRLVTAYLFRRGRLLYTGRGTFAFAREARTQAALRCDPQFSRVTARFHLPVGVAAPVAGGLLKLSGTAGQFSSSLRVQDEFGSFQVDELPGDVRYDVNMALSDQQGNIRYEADRRGVFLPLGEEAKWDMALLPSAAEAGLALSLGSPKEAMLETGFPSRLRKPAKPGEIIVSEFFAAPGEKDSSSQGEWFEVFNRSADTLALGGCRISRDRTTGVTRSYPFDSSRVLPPGKAMVFGRSAAPADAHYADFSLVNTASSLLLLCGGDSLLLDSLRYSATASDSAAVPMREGLVTGLDAGSMSRRAQAGSWCLTKPGGPAGKSGESKGGSAGESAGEDGAEYASPGKVQPCQARL
jgi:hypothetical protein